MISCKIEVLPLVVDCYLPPLLPAAATVAAAAATPVSVAWSFTTSSTASACRLPLVCLGPAPVRRWRRRRRLRWRLRLVVAMPHIVSPPPLVLSATLPHNYALTSSLPFGCLNLQRPTCHAATTSRSLAASASRQSVDSPRVNHQLQLY